MLTAWLGLCWALIEYASFLASRYGVSERWIDIVFTGMWALLPALLLIAWWIGEPGQMRWTARRLGLSGAFFVLGMLVVWRVDQSVLESPERSASSQLSVASIPASSTKTPHIALFPFVVESADPAHAWLGDALPILAEYDLSYDSRLRAASVASTAAQQFISTLRGYGAAEIETAPLALRRRASQTLGYDALVVGTVVVNGDRLRLRAELLRLNPDQALGPFEFETDDAWQAVDRLAALVREHLTAADDPRPANDPSLRSISTESLAALKAFVGGSAASERVGGHEDAEALFAQAVRADPSFVMAELSQQSQRHRRGEILGANQAIEALEPKLGILPERFRYRFQTSTAMAGGQFDRARSLYTLWAQQSPHDHEPRLGLVRLDLASKPDDPATWQALVELTEQHGSVADLRLLSAAALRREELADARRLADAGLARDPADAQMKLCMAAIERIGGHTGTARAYLNEAWLLRPDLLTTRITMATFQNDEGDWHAALETLADALQRARHNPDVLVQVLHAKIQLLAELGRIEAANRLLGELTTLQRGRTSPLAFKTWANTDIPLRVSGWGEARVRDWLAELDPIDDIAIESYNQAVVDERIAFQLRDPKRYRLAVQQMRKHWPLSFGISAETGMQLHEALAVAWERNDADSVEGLESALHAVRNLRVSTDDMRLAAVDQALRQRNSLAARRMLAPLLRGQSGRVSMRWRAAQISMIEGNRAQARRHLEPLLAAWAEADSDFSPLLEARALAAQMGAMATASNSAR